MDIELELVIFIPSFLVQITILHMECILEFKMLLPYFENLVGIKNLLRLGGKKIEKPCS